MCTKLVEIQLIIVVNECKFTVCAMKIVYKC